MAGLTNVLRRPMAWALPAMLALLAPAGASAAARHGDASAFVSRQGTELMLHGEPFRFSGPNIYWLGVDENARASTLTYPTHFRVRDALATAAYMGARVVRAHTLGTSTGCPLCVEPSLGHFNATALRRIDYAVATAHRYGLRLQIPLTDNYHYYHGGKHDFTDWLGLPESAFYTDDRAISAFEDYIRHLLDHVNVYAGIALKDDPTIAVWETGNELSNPVPPTSWTDRISRFIKGLAPHQLVIDGTYGINAPALSLADVDVYSDHFYPMSVTKLRADSAEVAAAGKAYVAGEYAWNNNGGGDPLPAFLQAIEHGSVAGDMYWSLFPHNDPFSYVQHNDGFQLHYPGDTPDLRAREALLREHAYAIAGRAAPPYPPPSRPRITSVERVRGDNLIEWRGAVGGAQYTVQRSRGRRRWRTVCDDCATDNDTPWPDRGAPGGPDVTYRVRALNPAGRPGPWSAPFRRRLRTVVDELSSWRRTSSHSAGLTLPTDAPELFGGDSARAARTSATPQEISWRLPDVRTFELVTYADPAQTSAGYLDVLVSADGRRWASMDDRTAVNGPLPIKGQATWQQQLYTLQHLHGVNYVKVAWTDTTSPTATTPQIGEMRATFRARVGRR